MCVATPFPQIMEKDAGSLEGGGLTSEAYSRLRMRMRRRGGYEGVVPSQPPVRYATLDSQTRRSSTVLVLPCFDGAEPALECTIACDA